jgi:osmoprotectant transport system permease protein
MTGSRSASAAFTCALLIASPALQKPALAAREDELVRVGSKKFTEGVILGDLAKAVLEQARIPATHRRELGGTRILWEALLRGDIDLYAEYTGTLREEILPELRQSSDAELRAALAERRVGLTAPLGFNDTYAIGMREERAEQLGIRRISDLATRPELRLGFSNEFIDREDGWPSLQKAYRLPHRAVRGLDHDLAYRALAAGEIDATDLYSTDAEIQRYRLRVLEDDLHHFPEYHALYLYRADLPERVVEALRILEGRISAAEMVAMNARAKLDRVPEPVVAADFLSAELGTTSEASVDSRATRILRRTAEHLALVAVSLFAAVVVAIPLGILAARRPRIGQAILAATGVIQTIPSLALLVFMIPLLGIGAAPAIAALFLYSLLPIVRNTHAGLTGIPSGVSDSAEALGLEPGPRLRWIDLPMASPSILAGIKTSAVINVGTATLGALIGAGGYGQPILTGIRLDDVSLILEGAIPAAALALLVQGGFDLLERGLVPKGLRLGTG